MWTMNSLGASTVRLLLPSDLFPTDCQCGGRGCCKYFPQIHSFLYSVLHLPCQVVVEVLLAFTNLHTKLSTILNVRLHCGITERAIHCNPVSLLHSITQSLAQRTPNPIEQKRAQLVLLDPRVVYESFSPFSFSRS